MTGPSFEPFASITAFPVLTTERLILREITWDDLPWYVRHFSLPEIVEGQGFPAPADEQEARTDFERRVIAPFAERDGMRWGLCLRTDAGQPDGRAAARLPLIGSATVFDVDAKVGSCEVGYDLDPAYWRRGLMLEAATAVLEFAFTVMGLNRIQAVSLPYNAASRGLLERLGFREEGVMREHSLDERGALVDDVLYSLLAREWRAGDR